MCSNDSPTAPTSSARDVGTAVLRKGRGAGVGAVTGATAGVEAAGDPDYSQSLLTESKSTMKGGHAGQDVWEKGITCKISSREEMD